MSYARLHSSTFGGNQYVVPVLEYIVPNDEAFEEVRISRSISEVSWRVLNQAGNRSGFDAGRETVKDASLVISDCQGRSSDSKGKENSGCFLR